MACGDLSPIVAGTQFCCCCISQNFSTRRTLDPPPFLHPPDMSWTPLSVALRFSLEEFPTRFLSIISHGNRGNKNLPLPDNESFSYFRSFQVFPHGKALQVTLPLTPNKNKNSTMKHSERLMTLGSNKGYFLCGFSAKLLWCLILPLKYYKANAILRSNFNA